MIWDSLPNTCQNGRSISSDNKTLTCVITDLDNNGQNYKQFPVRVTGDVPNGTLLGDITFDIVTANNETASDSILHGNNNNKLKVTAAPRWDLNVYFNSQQRGATDPATGKKGYIAYYYFVIASRRVPGETESLPSPYVGNEALTGLSDASITFDIDLSGMGPGAKIVDWVNNTRFDPPTNACDMDSFYDAYTPFPVSDIYTNKPARWHIPVESNVTKATCTQNGSTVSVTVDHINSDLTFAPTKSNQGTFNMLPSKAIASMGAIRVFIPYDYINKGEDDTDGTGDDGKRNLTLKVKNFNPVSITNQQNFNGNTESIKNNTNTREFKTYSDYYRVSFRQGWHYQEGHPELWDQQDPSLFANHTQWWRGYGGTHDDALTPNTKFGLLLEYLNNGVVELHDITGCAVIDTSSLEFVPFVDDPNTATDESQEAAELYWSNNGNTVPHMQYAVGYVNPQNWPMDPNVSPGDKITQECNDTAIVWYDSYSDAVQHGEVSKVRFVSDDAKPTSSIRISAKLRVKDTIDGQSGIANNDRLLVTYGTYEANETTHNTFYKNNFQPHDEYANPTGGYGNRLFWERAKTKVSKSFSATNVHPGDDVNVSISSIFYSNTHESYSDQVIIADLLPKGMSFKQIQSGSSYGSPQIISNPTDTECQQYVSSLMDQHFPCGTLNGGTGKETILVWDLGDKTTNEPIDDINFTVSIGVDADAGQITNYAEGDSPADGRSGLLAPRKTDNAKITNNVPQVLLMSLDSNPSTHEVSMAQSENWLTFTTVIRDNAPFDIEKIDVINILPFNGDGTNGGYTFNGNDKYRDPASSFEGNLTFDSMQFDDNGGACDASGITYWYTNHAVPMDISPRDASNTDVNGNPTSIWCQGDANGPDASCGYGKSDVTAVRTRDASMPRGKLCYFNVTLATANNGDGNSYSNSVGMAAKRVGGSSLNAFESNTAKAEVYGSSISGKAWHDTNEDGIQANDATEEPVEGIEVKLFDANNALVATTTTANDGSYTFANLKHGNYTIEVLPGNYNITAQAQGGDNTLDSDFDPTTKKANISLEEDQNINAIDVGLTTNSAPTAVDDTATTDEDTAVVVDVTANDTDSDGTIDKTTVTITQQPAHGTLSIDATTGKVTYTPNADYHGTDTFKYTVKDNDGSVSNAATVTITVNSVESVSGKVLVRIDGGNVKPMKDVTIVLYDANWNEIARKQTDEKGYYQFKVTPGIYHVQEIQPNGYYDFEEKEGGSDTDLTNTLLNTISADVKIGEDDKGNNFIESTKSKNPSCASTHPTFCNVCNATDHPAHASSLSDNNAKIEWNKMKNTVAYEIYLNDEFVVRVGKNVSQYAFDNLESGKEYTVKVVAVNGFGGKAEQIIHFKTSNSFSWLPAVYNTILN